jgi:hypothetical protein
MVVKATFGAAALEPLTEELLARMNAYGRAAMVSASFETFWAFQSRK